MDFFSRLSRTEPNAEPTDLTQVQADDALIEALRNASLFGDADTDTDRMVGAATLGGLLADPGPATSVSADIQVANLLRAWRVEIESVPLPNPLELQVATAIVRSAPPRRRALRPMLAVTAAIAALLMGSAAIGARSATPDSLLWPVTQMLWGDRADSVQAGLDARKGIDIASKALDAGHPDDAETALDFVTVVITKVEDRDGRQTLESDYQKVKQDLASTMLTTDPASPTLPATTSPAGAPTTTTSLPPTTGSNEPGSSDPGIPVNPGDTTTLDTGSSQPDPSSDPVDPSTSDSQPPDTTTSDPATTESTPDPTTAVTSETSITPPPDGGNGQTDTPTTPTPPADPADGGSVIANLVAESVVVNSP